MHTPPDTAHAPGICITVLPSVGLYVIWVEAHCSKSVTVLHARRHDAQSVAVPVGVTISGKFRFHFT